MSFSDNLRPVAYSFDVFDTCITRTCAHPRDLFYELGLRLAPAGLTDKEKLKFAARFQSLRIRAEKRAYRHAQPRQAVTIDEIYAHFPIPHSLATQTQDLIRAEIDLERDSIYPIPAVVSHIENLRRMGHRIIFISDMYLPSALLAPILKERGVMKEEDALYVSCDVGVTKHYGQLFQHVLKAEGLDASQLIHSGDNLHADIRMATRASIKASHFRGGMLTAREASMAGHQLPRHRARSFLPALTRRLRLFGAAQLDHKDDPLDHAIQGIIVPLLLAYVMWVLDHAKRNGIHRLYFVARDAEVMFRMAQALQSEGNGIELHYFYGSRRAWLSPSISQDNADWQRLLVIPGQASSRHDITARMGLDNGTQETIRKLLSCNATEWSKHLSHDQARRFLDELMGDTSTSELIVSSVTRKREIALSYFKQEGLFEDVSWALVDAGWSLNSQAALKRIMDIGGASHYAPQGYYLALARDHLDEAQAGVAYPFISKAGSIFSRRRVVIEHCFLPSTHATTRGYRMEGNRSIPVFGPELRSEAELAYVTRLHEAAVSAARLVSANPKIAAALTEHVGEILSTAEGLLRHPHKSDARAMATFGTVADMRHEKSFVKPLCRPLRPNDVWTVISMALSKRKSFESPSFMWLEGSMALSPWHVRIPLEFVLFVDSLRNRFKG
ncbi:HAD family hydrolase [Dyella flava]|uniref:Haloacid dehalogenase superfamily, subfamily IA, variant 1 with third motif having Dx(3-4)D or Dx(3-4)E n=1 Tax=Dyella flava TaxID=1920170 RepID=A0ABS2K992_9GAMM|nr:HAD family hydrolase [Dyella flava]MBM7126863.1 hypothetical protein [Dyella flava]GLQ50377.1 hypothetical protein GCM10010872_18260 [Dyella flava]